MCTHNCRCDTCGSTSTTKPTTNVNTTTKPTTTQPPPTAQPVCPPPDGGDRVILIHNPDDCNMYYDCTHGKPVPMHCPPGLYFCPEKEICNWVTDTECSYNCVRVNSKPVPVENNLFPQDLPECPPDRNDTVTFVPNPTNCTEYYMCDNGVIKPMVCPPDLYFCAELNACGWPDDINCNYDCTQTVLEVETVAFAEKKRKLHRPLNRPL
jgi:hypothetical protein